MIGPLGHLASIFALALAGLGAVAAFAGGATGRKSLIEISRDLSLAMCGFVVVMFLLLEYALVTHDFSVSYVAQVGSRQTPLFYTIASAWSALEGSIVLWALILAGYTAALVWWTRRRPEDEQLGPYALGTLLCVNVFFLMVVAWPGNPFESVSPVPENGPGPNPLLQNHPFMAVHPPLLYTGYVGMAVPFSLALAAVIRGRVDRPWARIVRNWTLVPWTFLTLGIIAGAWWSYEVLGWGGYWAWDPVENASFMPWLTATAFLHSIMVQERRSMLKTWTLSLIVVTFLLTVLGTFITRSGVLASVHAFTEGLIGPFFLGFFAVALVVSLALITWRSGRFRTEGHLEGALSRETAFLVNNLLFAAFTFVVLLGTLFPLVVEAIEGRRVSVGGPFFDQMTVPIALALVFLMGVGPALPWGRARGSRAVRKFRWPSAAALATGALLFVLGVREPLTLATFVLAVLSAGLLVGEFLEPARARHEARGESWLRALARVPMSNRRRYGGYIVHFGVLLIAVGIAASSTFRQEMEWKAEIGQPHTFAGYDIQLDSVWAVEEPQRDAVIAAVTVFDQRGQSADPLGRFFPRINYYPNSTQPIGTPAVHETLEEDLYLVLAAYAADGSHTALKAIVSPLVVWIWIGGIVMGLGAVFAGWPRRGRGADTTEPPSPKTRGRPRERRELAETAGD